MRRGPKPEPLPPVDTAELVDPADPLRDERDERIDRVHREFGRKRAALKSYRIPDFSQMEVDAIGRWFKEYAIRGDNALRRADLDELARAEMIAVWEVVGRDRWGMLTGEEARRMRKLERKEDDES